MAALALVVLSPILASIALLVRLTSTGPALFRQPRVGYRGRVFGMYKFRSMVAGAERHLDEDPNLRDIFRDNGHKVPADIDPRITTLGRVLRSTSLDELPQLLNVVRGEMSLVGPRPVFTEQLADYGHVTPAYTATRPGMTGMWQVNGRSEVPFPMRAYLDVENVRNWTLAKDLRILAMTVPSVMRRTGAF